MENKDYHKWSKDKLIAEIKTLLKRKKFGLVWEDKEEEVVTQCKHVLPVLREVKEKKIQNGKSDLQHIMIEGDNYHALSTLCYTHEKKIDVIYIDPPYNTGNKSWIYNNHYVEKDDRFKHSKWLSFMSKRLKLARNLLTGDGAIVVTVDDYEVFHLGLLMNEIFGEENKIGIVCVENKPGGRTTNKFFATSHEYYLFYAKNIEQASIENIPLTQEQANLFHLKDDVSKYRLLSFRRGGGLSTPEERPNSFYPIYFNKKESKIDIKKFKGAVEIFPVDTYGRNRVWRRTRPSLMEAVSRGDIVIKENGNKYTVYMKDRIKVGRKPKTVWVNPKYDASSHGTVLVDKILNKRKSFDYPKSIHAVYDALSIIVPHKKDSTILDFFAGSGTTGHAVMELNREDGGNRQFILCTSNENNNGNSGGGVAEAVCYPRIEKVMNGYTNLKKQKIDGLGGNLRYYKTDFVDQVRTDTDKRNLVNKSTEMLCLTENTFNRVLEEKGLYAVFENSERMMGIIYDEDAIDDFIEATRALKKPLVLYVFSYDYIYDEEEFVDIKNLMEIKPIPEAILNVYRRIYKNIRRS